MSAGSDGPDGGRGGLPPGGEIDEEIRHHLEGRVREFMEQGMDRAAAERRARERFGDADEVRRRTRAVYLNSPRGRSGFLAGLMAELVGAARALVRCPGFTLTALLLLAVGIGISTTTLALVDAYLLRGMPLPAAERLAQVRWERTEPEAPEPPPVDWEELASVVELAVSWDLDVFTLVGGDRPERVRGAWVPADFFTAFGIEPELGRGIAADEVGPAGAPVAVIGHELWQRRFGGDPEVLGRTLRMYASDRPEEAAALTVVGVLPADTWWPRNEYSEVLTPLTGLRRTYALRVAPGVGLEEAAERMNAHLADLGFGDGWTIRLVSMHDQHVDPVRPVMGALATAVALVLLIACANVAMLLLVQMASRGRELAVRAALGAGRGRLALRLMLETGLLAGVGGLAGVVGAAWLLPALAPHVETQLGTGIPGGPATLHLDPRVSLMAVGLAAACALGSALVPLLAGSGKDLTESLTQGGRTETGSRRQRWLRTGLIVGELALSLGLLVGAGLMVRSAWHLSQVDLGFPLEGRFQMGMILSHFRYPEPEQRQQRLDEIIATVAEIEGIDGAAAVVPHVFRWGRPVPVTALEGPTAEAEEPMMAAIRAVSPGYFATLGIPVIAGRDLDVRDRSDGEPVALVSRSLAGRLWPGGAAVGRSLRVGDPRAEEPASWHRVIGVVGDVQEGAMGEQYPDVYVPLAGNLRAFALLVVRSPRPLQEILPAVEERVWQSDPEQAIAGVAPLGQVVSTSIARPRSLAWLLAGFAGFAVILALVGVYGVVGFAARQRRREIAVRIAVGAAAADVRRLVLVEGARVVGIGLAVGLVASWLVAGVLSSQIHGVPAHDPLTIAALTAGLAIAGLAAVMLPARRAAATDPVELLQDE